MRIDRGAGRLGLLRGDPLGVVLVRQHFDDDRHVRVLLAAQLGTEPAEGADLLGLEPRVAHEARDRILLHAERGHVPRVDDVVRGRDDPDFLVDRHDERVVDFLQIGVGDGLLAHHFIARGGQRRQEADALARALHVVVAPLPLVAGDLDREIGVRRVLHRDDGLRRRQRHQHDDDERHDRPDDLDGRALMEISGLEAFGFAVREDRIEHHAEHADEDHRTEDQHHRVEIVELLGDLRDRRLKVDLVDTGAARAITDRQSGTGKEQSAACQHAREGSLDCFHSILTQNFHSNPPPSQAACAAPAAPLSRSAGATRAVRRRTARACAARDAARSQRSARAIPAESDRVASRPSRPAPSAG